MKPLEDSIRENGIIQPLMVRKDDKADVYEIISGHRRYLAATRLKLTEVPVVVLDITKEESRRIKVRVIDTSYPAFSRCAYHHPAS